MSFAREMEEVTVESGESESSDESNTPDYVESLNKGDFWSSSDEEQLFVIRVETRSG